MEALKLPTMQDILALPEDTRAELIDGRIYYQAAPSREHQEILHQLSYEIESYIRSKKGDCKVYPAPFAVFLQSDTVYVEPDVAVICDKGKLDNKGCHGAPDWIVEILSPSTVKRDTILKLKLYKSAGVREYWIVDPEEKTITVYHFAETTQIDFYKFSNKVKVGIYEDLEIDFSLIEV